MNNTQVYIDGILQETYNYTIKKMKQYILEQQTTPVVRLLEDLVLNTIDSLSSSSSLAGVNSY